MEQEHNPNKNAELAMEQNGNMIDGHHQQSACAAPVGKAFGQSAGTPAQAPQPGA